MSKLFDRWLRTGTIFAVLLDFSFVTVGIVIASMWVGSGLPVDFALVIAYAVLLAIAMLSINSFLGFYQRIHHNTLIQTQARAVLALHLSIPVAYGIFLLLPTTTPNQEFLQLAGMAALFGMLANRVRGYHSPPPQPMVNRILVFGTGTMAARVQKILTEADRTVRILGFYPGTTEEEPQVEARQVLATDKSLLATARELKVDEIVVAVTERRGGGLPLRDLLDCKLHGIRVLDLASHFEQWLGQIRLESLSAGWLVFGDGFRQPLVRRIIKRLFDLACSLILIVIASPIMVVTALLIVLESGFPIFYRQERVGKNGRLFHVIKFRSMRTDAEKDGKPRWAQAKDDRVTRVGRVIRKLRIDELPQLFSVLMGHMSLVGPRPERQYFVEQLTKEIPFYAVRHSLKPGVTGWAQVRYHYGASVEDSAEKLQYDLYYVKNHTLLLDLVILFETVGVVLTAKGAQ